MLTDAASPPPSPHPPIRLGLAVVVLLLLGLPLSLGASAAPVDAAPATVIDEASRPAPVRDAERHGSAVQLAASAVGPSRHDAARHVVGPGEAHDSGADDPADGVPPPLRGPPAR